MEIDPRLERRMAVRRAHQHLSRLIESRVLSPGDSLPTALDLSQEIGVSRPVVLDALKLLAKDGRVTVGRGPSGVRLAHPHGPQHQARLAWLASHSDKIVQMTKLRELVEPGISRLVAEEGMPRSLLRRARASIEGLVKRPSARQEILRLDGDFHRLIAQATGMEVLEEAALECRVWVSPAFDFLDWPPDRLDSCVAEHARILDAIEAGDPDEAALATLEHIRISSALINQKMAELSRGSTRRRKRKIS